MAGLSYPILHIHLTLPAPINGYSVYSGIFMDKTSTQRPTSKTVSIIKEHLRKCPLCKNSKYDHLRKYPLCKNSKYDHSRKCPLCKNSEYDHLRKCPFSSFVHFCAPVQFIKDVQLSIAGTDHKMTKK
jgi:hypothetical protein